MSEIKEREVDLVVSISDLKKLTKNNTLQTFELVPFVDAKKAVSQDYLNTIKQDLFQNMPL
jgi:ligand-binding sensor protein